MMSISKWAQMAATLTLTIACSSGPTSGADANPKRTEQALCSPIGECDLYCSICDWCRGDSDCADNAYCNLNYEWPDETCYEIGYDSGCGNYAVNHNSECFESCFSDKECALTAHCNATGACVAN
jgi:hypothetical protein